MAKTDFIVPALGDKFVDLRDTLPGDAYNWSWIRELSQITCLAIHHSGGPDNQTSQDIANLHIQDNGWGGIGYHFLVDKEGFVYYVGDLQTARANVADLNEQVIGICLIGNFTSNIEPSLIQLDSAHRLCEFLIILPELINVKGWDKVLGHKELPDQSTNCPGDNWSIWKEKLINGPKVNGTTTAPAQSGGIIFNQPHKDQPFEANQEAILKGQLANLQETVHYQKTQIDSLQVSLATVNGQLISCRENLQDAEAKLSFAKQTGTVPVKPSYLPLILLAISGILTFSINLNLLSMFLGIQTDTIFLDLIFSAFLIAWIFSYLKSLMGNLK